MTHSKQHSDTKMRPIRDTIPIAEALELILSSVLPVTRTSRIALTDAHRRVLSSNITATQDVPPFNRAAMDGFAVMAEDTFGASRQKPQLLRCVEAVHTGNVPTKVLSQRDCTEIATGAPMPRPPKGN